MLYSRILTTTGVSRSIFNDDFALTIKDDTLSGENAYRHSVVGAEMDFTGDFTLEFWHYIKEPVNPSGIEVLYTGKSDNFRDAPLMSIYEKTNIANWRFVWFSSIGVANELVVNGQAATNSWNHFVLSFEKGIEIRLYVNNIKASTSVNTVIAEEVLVDSGLLSFSGGAITTFGFARRNRIYCGRAATDADVSNMFALGVNDKSIIASMQASLVRNYNFNQESGRYLIDSSTFKKNGELLDQYTDEEVKLNGGAWVDVSAIG